MINLQIADNKKQRVRNGQITDVSLRTLRFRFEDTTL